MLSQLSVIAVVEVGAELGYKIIHTLYLLIIQCTIAKLSSRLLVQPSTAKLRFAFILIITATYPPTRK